MLEFSRLSNQSFEDCKRYVSNHRNSQIYHLPEWINIFKETYGYDHQYYLLYSSNREIVGVIPFIWIKGLFKNYLSTAPASLLFNENFSCYEEVRDFLLRMIREYPTKDIELLNPNFRIDDWKSNKDSVMIRKELPSDKSILWREIGSKRRNMVRKTEKYNLKISIEETTDRNIESFYKIYSHNYRDLGTPVSSKKYFVSQAKHLYNHIKIMFAFYDSLLIGVMWLLHFNNTMSIPEAASLRKYFHTGVNDLMYYKAFEFAIDSKCSLFDMGRSQVGSGTYKFKSSWGDTRIDEYELLTFKEGDGINENKEKYRNLIKLWKKTPIPLTNLIGPWIRKHIRLD